MYNIQYSGHNAFIYLHRTNFHKIMHNDRFANLTINYDTYFLLLYVALLFHPTFYTYTEEFIYTNECMERMR